MDGDNQPGDQLNDACCRLGASEVLSLSFIQACKKESITRRQRHSREGRRRTAERGSNPTAFFPGDLGQAA